MYLSYLFFSMICSSSSSLMSKLYLTDLLKNSSRNAEASCLDRVLVMILYIINIMTINTANISSDTNRYAHHGNTIGTVHPLPNSTHFNSFNILSRST